VTALPRVANKGLATSVAHISIVLSFSATLLVNGKDSVAAAKEEITHRKLSRFAFLVHSLVGYMLAQVVLFSCALGAIFLHVISVCGTDDPYPITMRGV
jgi:hypothetical protein